MAELLCLCQRQNYHNDCQSLPLPTTTTTTYYYYYLLYCCPPLQLFAASISCPTRYCYNYGTTIAPTPTAPTAMIASSYQHYYYNYYYGTMLPAVLPQYQYQQQHYYHSFWDLLLLLAISATASPHPLSNLQLVPQQLHPTQLSCNASARRRRLMTQHNHSF